MDNIKASVLFINDHSIHLLTTDRCNGTMIYCCSLYCDNSHLLTKMKLTLQYQKRRAHRRQRNEDQLCMYAAGGATKHYSESIQPVGSAAAPASPRRSKAESTKLFSCLDACFCIWIFVGPREQPGLAAQPPTPRHRKDKNSVHSWSWQRGCSQGDYVKSGARPQNHHNKSCKKKS